MTLNIHPAVLVLLVLAVVVLAFAKLPGDSEVEAHVGLWRVRFRRRADHRHRSKRH